VTGDIESEARPGTAPNLEARVEYDGGPPSDFTGSTAAGPVLASRRRGFRWWLLWTWLVVLIASAAAVAALSGAGDGDVPDGEARRGQGSAAAVSPACRGAWAAAAGTARADRSVRDLDGAIQVCTSLAEWRGAAQAHPRALGGAGAMARLKARCRASEALGGTALCGRLPD
jgi:hypothetical protein